MKSVSSKTLVDYINKNPEKEFVIEFDNTKNTDGEDTEIKKLKKRRVIVYEPDDVQQRGSIQG